MHFQIKYLKNKYRCVSGQQILDNDTRCLSLINGYATVLMNLRLRIFNLYSQPMGSISMIVVGRLGFDIKMSLNIIVTLETELSPSAAVYSWLFAQRIILSCLFISKGVVFAFAFA